MEATPSLSSKQEKQLAKLWKPLKEAYKAIEKSDVAKLKEIQARAHKQDMTDFDAALIQGFTHRKKRIGSILHFAIDTLDEGSVDIIQHLINMGADVHAKNINGETPLDFAHFSITFVQQSLPYRNLPKEKKNRIISKLNQAIKILEQAMKQGGK